MKVKIERNLSDFGKAALINLLEQRLMVGGISIEQSTLVLPDTVSNDAHSDLLALVRTYADYASRLKLDRLYEQDSAAIATVTHLDSLLETDNIVKLGDGLYSFQGTFLDVVERIDNVVKGWAVALHAREQDHPVLWPMDLLKKIHYISEFPQLAFLVTGAKDDIPSCQRLAALATESSDGEIAVEPDILKPFQFGMQNAVCDCCYYGLESRDLSETTIFTTSNKVIRNERKSTAAWGRLRCFRVRDIMVVGDKNGCEATLQAVLENVVEFLRATGLYARIETANDPFFGDEVAMKSVFQNARHLKYEILSRLDACGPDIAVGSINRHQDFFSKAFDIRMGGERAVSACVGIGLERLAMALFAHWGPATECWPASLRKVLWDA